MIEEVLADLTTLHHTPRVPSGRSSTFAAAPARETEPVAIRSEDFGTVMVRFDSGARGSFVVSQTSAGRKNQLTLRRRLRAASLAWEQERPERVVDRAAQRRQPRARPRPRAARGAGRVSRALPAGHPEGWNDALRNSGRLLRERDARHNGDEHATSLATFADGHRVVQLVDGIVDSHERGAWVAVGRPLEVGA